MRNKDATARFKQATDHYKRGQVAKALEILNDLDAAFPEQKNLMYPRALCLRDLGREAESRAICEALAQKFDDPRAKKLLAQFSVIQDPMAHILDIPILEDAPHFRSSSSTGAPRRAVSAAPDWAVWTITAAILLALFVGGALLQRHFRGLNMETLGIINAESAQESPREEVLANAFTAMGRSLPILLLSTLFFALVKEFISLYLTLHIVDKLPETDTVDNIKTVALMAGVFGLLCVLFCVGTIVKIVLMRKKYEMAYTEILVWAGISFAYYCVTGVLTWIVA